MSEPGAATLDRQVTIVKRVTGARDAGGTPVVSWSDQSPPLWAARTDATAGERLRAQGVSASVNAHFRVRAEDAEGVAAEDRIRDEDAGELFEILGVRRLSFAWLEINAGAQVDG